MDDGARATNAPAPRAISSPGSRSPRASRSTSVADRGRARGCWRSAFRTPASSTSIRRRMLAEARRRLPGVAFEQVDIAHWRPERPPDLIFANGALEWVPDHQALFPRLMAQVAEGGTLAVQMPDTTQVPTDALMRLIGADGPWSDRLVPIAKTRAVIAPYTDFGCGRMPPHSTFGRRPTSIRSRASMPWSIGFAAQHCARSSRRSVPTNRPSF
jgi:hypothetical protein